MEYNSNADTNCSWLNLKFPKKGLEKRRGKLEIREIIKTLQSRALLRIATVLKRVLETLEDFPSLRR